MNGDLSMKDRLTLTQDSFDDLRRETLVPSPKAFLSVHRPE